MIVTAPTAPSPSAMDGAISFRRNELLVREVVSRVGRGCEHSWGQDTTAPQPYPTIRSTPSRASASVCFSSGARSRSGSVSRVYFTVLSAMSPDSAVTRSTSTL